VLVGPDAEEEAVADARRQQAVEHGEQLGIYTIGQILVKIVSYDTRCRTS
jgi:hypothetical protein